MPIFALANAGVALDGDMLERALSSTITLGVVVGLVAGKLFGIYGISVAAQRAGLGRLPDGVERPHLLGGAALAGIGFTVALFIAELAFEDPELREEAKVGVLAASLIAALLATVLFRLAGARDGTRPRPSRHGWTARSTPTSTTSAATRTRR